MESFPTLQFWGCFGNSFISLGKTFCFMACISKHGWASFVLCHQLLLPIYWVAVGCIKLQPGNELQSFILCTPSPLQHWLRDDFIEVVMQNTTVYFWSPYPFWLWRRTFSFTDFSIKPGDRHHLCRELKALDWLPIRGKSCKNEFIREGRWRMLLLSWTGRETRM